MSNLDADIRRAMELGYGVHYGKYKADHPEAAAQEEAPTQDTMGMVECLECGRKFLPRRKGMQYCNKWCRDRRVHRLRYQKLKEERNEKTVGK